MMKELEPLIDELGDMYDELAARVLSFNTINEKYGKLSFMELTKEMVKIIFKIRRGFNDWCRDFSNGRSCCCFWF